MTATPVILLLLLLSLAGCLAPPSHSARVRPISAMPEAEYVSHVEDPGAKALYYFGVARLTAVDGDYVASASALQQALRYDPRSAYLHLFLAEVYLSMNEADKAIRSAEDALIYAPDDPRPYLLLGNLYFDLGQDDEAIPRLEKALSLDPELQPAYLRLGVAYARSGDSEQAVAVLQVSTNVILIR
ncbi:MAG: tetratricopeptide repeat protein [Syntrophotaleaceae bacterium]